MGFDCSNPPFRQKLFRHLFFEVDMCFYFIKICSHKNRSTICTFKARTCAEYLPTFHQALKNYNFLKIRITVISQIWNREYFCKNFLCKIFTYCEGFIPYFWMYVMYHWKYLVSLLKRFWEKSWNIHCVKSVRIRRFSGPHFPAFGLNKLCIQSECGKIRIWKTPNTDTFHAVIIFGKERNEANWKRPSEREIINKWPLKV